VSGGDWTALSRRFFERPVVELAAALVGTVLVRGRGRNRMAGRIVEVEAYGGLAVDPSAHSFRGPTPRCEVMFGPAGHAYVYTTHQGRCCLNVTAQGDRRGKAVLIRALEPLVGLAAMRASRLAALDEGPTRARLLRGAEHTLACGPACICLALSIDRSLNGVDLTDARSPLWLARATQEPADAEPADAGPIGADAVGAHPAGIAPRPLLWTPRIGLNPKSASFGWRWRAFAAGSRSVSAGSGGARAARVASRRPRPAACP
jgi:DNA-3-methyladenine glycosylase